MSEYQAGAPVPPQGSEAYAQQQANAAAGYTAPATAAATTAAADKKAAKQAKREAKQRARAQKKAAKGSSGGGFLKGIVGGIVGAIVVLAVFLALWNGTGLFDSMKTTTVTSSGGTITIENSDDATTAQAVAAKCVDSVVTIYVYSTSSDWTQYFDSSSSSSSSEPDALGSGVIIKSEDGYSYILTNYHVVEDITRAVVKVGDEQYEAEAVGADSKSDLAVIRIAVDGLTVLEWGDSDEVTVGDWVMAIGSPYGYENTCTTGIVSALYRSDVLSDSTTLSTTVYTDMIQTDAAINPGNSGGALVNDEGQLIGINTYISSTSESSAGLGFAIPASTAQEVAETLMSGETVSHAFLGITMQETTDGVQVTSVYANTAAAEAGLQTGDIITAVDGESITSAEEISVAVTAKSVGDTLEITYTRDGVENTVTATLGSDTADTSEYAENGSPSTDSSSDDGYYYYDDSSDSYGLGDMLEDLFGGGSSDGSSDGFSFDFGNSGDGSDDSSGDSDSSDGGSFWD